MEKININSDFKHFTSNIINLFNDENFIINLVLHSIIIFTILSIFFIFVISKLSEEIFNEEISHIFIHNIPFNKINDSDSNIINKLINIYSDPDKTIKFHNDGIINSLIIINILLWIGFIIIVLILYNCKMNLHITHIIIENIFVFFIIGNIEYIFFKYIASKFIPVEPSFISKKFLEIVKNEFNK